MDLHGQPGVIWREKGRKGERENCEPVENSKHIEQFDVGGSDLGG